MSMLMVVVVVTFERSTYADGYAVAAIHGNPSTDLTPPDNTGPNIIFGIDRNKNKCTRAGPAVVFCVITSTVKNANTTNDIQHHHPMQIQN